MIKYRLQACVPRDQTLFALGGKKINYNFFLWCSSHLPLWKWYEKTVILIFLHFSLCLKWPGKSTEGLNYRVAIFSSTAPVKLVDQAINQMHLRCSSWVPRGQEQISFCVRKAIDSRTEPATAWAPSRHQAGPNSAIKPLKVGEG